MEEEYRTERHHSTSKNSIHTNDDASPDETNGSSEQENGDGGPVDTVTEITANGDDHQQAEHSIERPEQTVASEVVKSGKEDVSIKPFHYIHSLNANSL